MEQLRRKIEKLSKAVNNPAMVDAERAIASAKLVELTTELLAGRPIPSGG